MLINKPWCVVSVHKSVRELDAKLYLSFKLLSRDFNIILGRSGPLLRSCQNLPKGIYCEFRHLITRKKHVEKLRNHGFKVVAFDEEAPSFVDPIAYARVHVSEEVVSLCDQCYTWGDYHHDVAIGAVSQDLKYRFHCTGHPRFDMLREPAKQIYLQKINEIKSRYKDFVLLTSNTGAWVLDGDVDEKWDSYRLRGIIEDNEQEYSKFYSEFKHRMARHESLVELVRMVAKARPNLNIVIRPHFNETEAHWNKSFANRPSNIHIIHEGSSSPWIMAASIIIHNSCTSAIEAVLARTPAITFRSIRDDRFDALLPNDLSIEASTTNDVIYLIDKFLNSERSNQEAYWKEKDPLFDRYFAARKGVTATDRVMHLIASIAFRHSKNIELIDTYIRSRKMIVLQDQVFGIINEVKKSIKRILSHFLRFKNIPLEPRITKETIDDRIAQFRKFDDSLGEKEILVSDLGEEIFFIRTA